LTTVRIGILVLMAGREAGGPETYEVELIRALAEIDRKNEYVIYCTGGEAPAAIGVQQDNVRYRVLRPGSRAISVAVTLPAMLVRDGIDFLHSTFTPPPFRIRPEVLTMHCLSSFVHPEFYSPLIAWRLNSLLRIGMRRAERVLCVSQSTADDVHERFRIGRERLAVAHNGVSARFHPVPAAAAREQIREALNIEGPYALFVGKLEPRKNVMRLLEAFSRFRRDTGSETKLLLAGNRTAVTPKIDALIDRLGLRDSVLRPGYVSSDLLAPLYSGARMFLLPSLWEGFGIPIVEAMACGTPVLTSNVTCLPEIAGDAAVIVDPESPDSIAEGIARLDGSEDLRRRLGASGLQRARLFTWDNSARRTLAVYEEMTRH
ncbi:MAG: glycosyltransferase family 4 protein, partial [Chloroflexota bacterium]|nr:glycosyltransferase family 4 protein [Chloroflexota bacterium]